MQILAEFLSLCLGKTSLTVLNKPGVQRQFLEFLQQSQNWSQKELRVFSIWDKEIFADWLAHCVGKHFKDHLIISKHTFDQHLGCKPKKHFFASFVSPFSAFYIFYAKNIIKAYFKPAFGGAQHPNTMQIYNMRSSTWYIYLHP